MTSGSRADSSKAAKAASAASASTPRSKSQIQSHSQHGQNDDHHDDDNDDDDDDDDAPQFLEGGKVSVRLRTLTPWLVCRICLGYCVTPTVIVECMHPFCKSCIVKHIRTTRWNATRKKLPNIQVLCPECDHPLYDNPYHSLKQDRLLADILQLLLPDVVREELARHQQFLDTLYAPQTPHAACTPHTSHNSTQVASEQDRPEQCDALADDNQSHGLASAARSDLSASRTRPSDPTPHKANQTPQEDTQIAIQHPPLAPRSDQIPSTPPSPAAPLQPSAQAAQLPSSSSAGNGQVPAPAAAKSSASALTSSHSHSSPFPPSPLSMMAKPASQASTSDLRRRDADLPPAAAAAAAAAATPPNSSAAREIATPLHHPLVYVNAGTLRVSMATNQSQGAKRTATASDLANSESPETKRARLIANALSAPEGRDIQQSNNVVRPSQSTVQTESSTSSSAIQPVETSAAPPVSTPPLQQLVSPQTESKTPLLTYPAPPPPVASPRLVNSSPTTPVHPDGIRSSTASAHPAAVATLSRVAEPSRSAASPVSTHSTSASSTAGIAGTPSTAPSERSTAASTATPTRQPSSAPASAADTADSVSGARPQAGHSIRFHIARDPTAPDEFLKSARPSIVGVSSNATVDHVRKYIITRYSLPTDTALDILCANQVLNAEMTLAVVAATIAQTSPQSLPQAAAPVEAGSRPTILALTVRPQLAPK
ncbi:hypothetical protein CAOG_07886 [Capsaspora owczarzaki ATCC 30864]|uniref:RING-type domain-containing protein n=1 Tax=Capsaspora owczarzaki (strain ATCC 30864) TaxID=595528 RepID=A0A0D2W0N2_CAPO3|nr:hypothetical protein CAOG_07886 [Capsaspora owczarzaki ATCC 30864]KJE97787.1 hypothetical protein CAOG_007886 [Capsaspora owczarzaki ATCC 30864]|eukprot:XP_004342971.1 hypothetical protein CAOG_07886 [Capsaspora owczarzaki ATCC 30864]